MIAIVVYIFTAGSYLAVHYSILLYNTFKVHASVAGVVSAIVYLLLALISLYSWAAVLAAYKETYNLLFDKGRHTNKLCFF